MRLEYGNLVIRTAEMRDCAQLAEWWNDGNVMAHAGFPNGLGVTQDAIAEKLREGLLVVEENGVSIGEMNYRHSDAETVEIGIKICRADCRNRGVGRVLLSMLIEYLFAQGYRKIMLDTNLSNVRAQHVYGLLGFQKLRVNINSWRDQLGMPQSSVDYELTADKFNNFCRKEM